MAATAEIKAVITADDRASKTVGAFGTKLGDISVGAAAAGAAIFGMGKMAIDFGIESVKAYTEAERSSKMLENAVINVSHATREQLSETTKLAEAISKKGVLDDDVIKQGLAQLSTFRLQNSSVQRLAQSMADLTVNQFGVKATGEQAADAANMMAKALNGQFGVLQRSGIIFSEAQKNTIQFGTETEKVSAVIAGFAENLKYTNDVAKLTGEGALAAMDVTLGNMQETIGQALLPTIIVLANKLSEFVSSDQFKAWLEKVTAWIRDELPKFMTKLFDEYIPKAKAAFDEWWPKIMQVVGAIGAMISAIVWVGNVINDTSANVGLAIGYIVLWFNDAKNAIENFGYNTYNALSNIGRWFYQKFQEIKSWIGNVLNEITSWFRSLPSSIANGLGGLWGAITDPFRKAFDWVKDQANKVKDAVRNALDPNKKQSPSLVDRVQLGTQTIKDEYASLFSNLQGYQSDFRVTNLAQPVQPTQPLAPTSNQSSTINITISSMYSAGSEVEKRKFAKDILGALQDVANQKNTTVSNLMGA